MPREVKLSELADVLEGLPYPLERSTARAELADVTLVYADGDESATAVIDRIDADVFDDPASLEMEMMNVLPVESVGEPGQSEGEG